MGVLEEMSEFLQKGKAEEVKTLVQKAIDEKIDAKTILEEGLMAGMNIIGHKFKLNEVYVPEVLIAARAMNAGIGILRPFLVDAGVQARGTVVLGTVKGDLHDIGKNLVKMMMEGKGLEVIDMGTDVSAEKFIAAAKEKNASIIACSALLTTTMTQMQKVVEAAKAGGIREKITIMIGGAPVTEAYCNEIGADIYTADAASAAERAAAAVA